MPYTPPSQRSLANSTTHTPRQSLSNASIKQSNGGVPSSKPPATSSLPRSSTSYLNRHRRSPSVTESTASFSVGPADQDEKLWSEDTAAENTRRNKILTSAESNKDSSHASSSQNSSDDENPGRKDRSREPPNLEELRAILNSIEQHRESSPTRADEEKLQCEAALGLNLPHSIALNKGDEQQTDSAQSKPLSASARKISHSRSSTEMSALLDVPNDVFATPTRSASESDLEDLDEDPNRPRPIPLRKKSGELVKPVLTKGGLRRRPSSMPGTPTFTKAVHFDSNSLENVKTFSGTDRPIVVSAGTSPAEQYANEIEFPFGDDPARDRKAAFEWEIRLSHFPRETPERNLMAVRVERVYLSACNGNLLGAIAVANLAFHKLVVVRFTLDYWKTTSEVVADYNSDVRRKQMNDGYDRFLFCIKLEDLANIENKTMFFCVRYAVNGQEFWDNNNSFNYQVDFAKKPRSSPSARQGTQGSSLPLPRSKASHSTSSVRPRSFPSAMDDFGQFDSSTFAYQEPPAQIVGDSPIRFKNKKTAEETNGSSQPFGSRYNFGVSLHDAIAAVSPNLGERGDPKYKPLEKLAPPRQLAFAPQPMVESGSNPSANIDNRRVPTDQKVANGKTRDADSKPAALTAEKPSLQSKSYQDLLNSYCFPKLANLSVQYGSSKPPQKPSTHDTKSKPTGQTDGAIDEPNRPEPAHAESKSPATSATVQEPSKPSGDIKKPSRVTSPKLPRSRSPAKKSEGGSRASSPVAFGYPYPQPMQNGLFAESHTPTAIHG
ncbi:MAG: hypothetical protein Q9220_006337 [cf. Caloplaca sp. 1 TL-2023]